jgi:hypothetical protein
LIHSQILAHVERSTLLSMFQSGFKCGHSTTTALVKVTEDLKTLLFEGKVTVLFVLDFEKNFEIIDHSLFFY